MGRRYYTLNQSEIIKEYTNQMIDIMEETKDKLTTLNNRYNAIIKYGNYIGLKDYEIKTQLPKESVDKYNNLIKELEELIKW